jgi:tRNA uracil 4-sulfurtransferase
MKGLLLLSGGIDSPVAGHLMLKQNVDLIALHFSNEPITDDEPELKTKKLAKIIGISKVYVIPFGKTLEHITNKIDNKYYFRIMRRLMYKIAEKIALREGCEFLVTGENLAQVGSQTLENLGCIDESINMKVLRPILCNDKVETIKVAVEIETFETSKGPEACAILGPKHPITKAKLDKVLKEESKIDVDSIVSECFKSCRD